MAEHNVEEANGPSTREWSLFGLGIFLIVVGSSWLWWSISSGASSSIFFSALLLGTGIWLTHLAQSSIEYLSGSVLSGWMLFVTGLALWGMFAAAPWSIALGAFGGASLVAPLAITIRRHSVKPLQSVLLLIVGLAAYGTGGLLVILESRVLVGGVLLLGGLVLYRGGMLAAIGHSTHKLVPTLVALVVFIVGVTLMFLAVRGADVAIGLVGSLIICPALVALAVVVPEADYGPLEDKSFVALGGLFLPTAIFMFWSSGLNGQFSLLVALGCFLVGVALGRSGEVIVLGLAIAVVLGWVSVNRVSDSEVRPPFDDSKGRIVAIGDSYISGEGATAYIEGTNVVGADRNECRRASTAYPFLVAGVFERQLDFLACSGARTSDVLLPASEDDRVSQMPDSPDSIPGALHQLEYLRRDPDGVDVVLVSIGGNDARFSEIAQGCFLPGTCAELRDLWLSNVETIGPSVRAVYRQVKEIVGDDVPIVAMPYPMLLAEGSCGWSLLSSDEHDFLVEFLTILNQQIFLSAQREGVNFFTDGLSAFDGERICESGQVTSSAMNLIRLEPPSGDLSAALSPPTWIHGSLHPTVRGHQLTATALEPYLEALLESDDANPDPNASALLQIASIRSAQPVAIEAAVLEELQLPGSPLACRQPAPGPFGERVLLVDQLSEDGSGHRVPSFVLSDADPTATICFKEGNGPWRLARPEIADLGSMDLDEATGTIPVVVEDGVVSVQSVVPDDGDRLLVLYRTDAGDRQLRIVEFCSEVEACPATVREWTNTQLARTSREAAAPVVLAILAGWFLVVGAYPRLSDGDDSQSLLPRMVTWLVNKARGSVAVPPII